MRGFGLHRWGRFPPDPSSVEVDAILRLDRSLLAQWRGFVEDLTTQRGEPPGAPSS
jgi:hypothetical protein